MIAALYYVFILGSIGIAALFQVLFVKSKLPLILACSLLWLVPIGYETWVLNTCAGECNIRVDLVFMFLLEVVVLGVLSFFSWRAYTKHQNTPRSL